MFRWNHHTSTKEIFIYNGTEKSGFIIPILNGFKY